MLPNHGKIECSECYPDRTKIISPDPEWRMINDPGAWGGGLNPEYLVLGFSKGSTQEGIYTNGRFEDVAFAGMRPRLTQALQALGALASSETSDEKINDPNSNIAFGSLIRCSVSRLDKKASIKKGSNIYACTGPLISKSFKEIPHVINKCANKYLTDLPSTIKVVFFLGNTDSYVQSCQLLISELFPEDFKQINPMAVKANNRIWIHLAHPSGLNGHFKTWLNEATGAGLKRIQAVDAMPIKNDNELTKPLNNLDSIIQKLKDQYIRIKSRK